MLYFIHGTDYIKVLEKSKQMVDAMLSKKPDASLFKLNTENWSDTQLQEFVGGQGLFENKYIVSISKILEEKDKAETTLAILSQIADSDNIFIWTEEKVDKKTLGKIEKLATKTQVFEKKTEAKKYDFNIFSLGDALIARDKKRLWILYQEALRFHAPEEIHGTIFWQVKNILLSFKTSSATEAGLKPFVYSKAKQATEKYSKEEADAMSSGLIDLYHRARRGGTELDIALEKFILSI